MVELILLGSYCLIFQLQIIPSHYISEMKMSTLERLKSLQGVQIDNYVPSGSKSTKIVLSFSPKIIVFQNFKPNDKIVAKFSVKNVSKVRILKFRFNTYYLRSTLLHLRLRINFFQITRNFLAISM